MKRFMKLMSIVFVLGAMATASTVGDTNPTTVKGGGNHCDVLEHIMGMCRSSENILK